MSAFSLQRILPVLLASALACGSVCAQKDLSKAESEKLDSLRFSYDLQREEITQKQFVEPLEKLRNEYKARMERVQKGFEETGDLQSALASREAAKVDPTAATINRRVAQVGSVQSIFLDQKRKIEIRVKQSLEELGKSHVAELATYKVKLTKTGRLDSALVIDQAMKEFKAKGRAAAGVRPRPPVAPKPRVQGAANWAQVGRDLDGKAAGDNSGQAVSLSASGKLLAVGAPFNDGNGQNSGLARIFQVKLISEKP
jgi:hypothetical protein